MKGHITLDGVTERLEKVLQSRVLLFALASVGEVDLAILTGVSLPVHCDQSVNSQETHVSFPSSRTSNKAVIFQIFIVLDGSQGLQLSWTEHDHVLLSAEILVEIRFSIFFNPGYVACQKFFALAKLVWECSVADVQETFFSNQSGASFEEQGLGVVSD